MSPLRNLHAAARPHQKLLLARTQPAAHSSPRSRPSMPTPLLVSPGTAARCSLLAARQHPRRCSTDAQASTHQCSSLPSLVFT
ncbi:hypothetical protein PanWU01x14_128190 [Parasponia andersonii]|uniref:Uncharacterized protein n=1 Tax=Parasponia andersonii TaxID=3476 RepID=A0A2P5CS56_PARAD|nr:hypothetical protein PanWU01x14_128190 [Parasponia andersonii]